MKMHLSLFFSVLSGMMLRFVNGRCERHFKRKSCSSLSGSVVLDPQCTGFLQCSALIVHTGQLHPVSSTFPSNPLSGFVAECLQ